MTTHLSIIWHMHQPCYEDPKTAEIILPWVRLHCVKDYLDMLLITEEFPGLSITFNLVPSLLEQIEGYANGKTDRFYKIANIKAEDMNEEQRLFVLSNFFLCNPPTMILPHKRYAQLFYKRGIRAETYMLKDVLSAFTHQDITDLIVWFNLVWIDSLHIKNDNFLKGLIQKQRDFTHQEQRGVLEKHIEIIKKIIPAYRKAKEEKRIEISTTPYFHPILPLLCDTDIAQQSNPDAVLPSIRFKYPEDAQWHINQAISSYEKYFLTKPQGLWPSEGSISEQALGIIKNSGINWVATDEIILERSLGKQLKPEERNRVYKFSDINIFFRDHTLSDRIGFVYSKWQPEDAVSDFLNTLKQSRESSIVTIILDGENAWEYYKNDGEDFLKALYKAVSTDTGIKPITPSGYLQKEPTRNILSRVVPGSWIDGTFRIWIGHPEKNKAWELLNKARQDVFSKTNNVDILRFIYIAEGSDWNWWYGGDNHTANALEFDRLFRAHLMYAYQRVGLPVPSELDIPIKKHKMVLGRAPVYKITPVVDGLDTNYFEWADAGFIEPGSGSMQRTEKIVEKIWYGFDEKNVYFRVDFKTIEPGYEVIISFPDIEKGISVQLNKKGILDVSLLGFNTSNKTSYAGMEKILEISIERNSLDAQEVLHWALILKQQEKEILRLPEFDVYTISVPGKDFESKSWIV